MKKIFCIFIAIALCLCMCACGGPSVQVESNVSAVSMFVEVENNSSWRIVYHRETKVMYAISQSSSNYGNFTVLLNADGTPQTWKGY
jgi:hypothetical protein